ncbi:MAG: histidine triad nucleotide-binding protein [Candidatus Omnitrophica bacterium]|nr:histidine triad nucleotide-binding protein [Candidatus Omnitrophota bacterium]
MSEADCIFCKIAKGEIPAKKIWEDDDCLAFLDINPQAPQHIILIPRRHIETIAQTQEGDQALLGSLLLAAKSIARDEKLERPGYRLVINCGPGGGQTVYHIHVHILGGRPMKWPPG